VTNRGDSLLPSAMMPSSKKNCPVDVYESILVWLQFQFWTNSD